MSKVKTRPFNFDLLAFLAGIAQLHQAIIDKINARQVQKAKVNQGPTSSPKVVPSNQISRTPGPRGDAFRVNSSALLAYLREDRERIEAELRMEKAIAQERAARDAAKSEFMQLTKK